VLVVAAALLVVGMLTFAAAAGLAWRIFHAVAGI
jgi:hypothetical protein